MSVLTTSITRYFVTNVSVALQTSQWRALPSGASTPWAGCRRLRAPRWPSARSSTRRCVVGRGRASLLYNLDNWQCKPCRGIGCLLIYSPTQCPLNRQVLGCERTLLELRCIRGLTLLQVVRGLCCETPSRDLRQCQATGPACATSRCVASTRNQSTKLEAGKSGCHGVLELVKPSR